MSRHIQFSLTDQMIDIAALAALQGLGAQGVGKDEGGGKRRAGGEKAAT